MKIPTQYLLIMPMGQSKAMQVTQPGGQLCKQCKWCHLVAKFATNASGAIWWSNLQLMQVAPFSGQIWNLCKWRHLVAKYATNASHGVNFQSHIMVVLLTENIFQVDKTEKYIQEQRFRTNQVGCILCTLSTECVHYLWRPVHPLYLWHCMCRATKYHLWGHWSLWKESGCSKT